LKIDKILFEFTFVSMSSSQQNIPSNESTISIDINARDNISSTKHNNKEIKIETVA